MYILSIISLIFFFPVVTRNFITHLACIRKEICLDSHIL